MEHIITGHTRLAGLLGYPIRHSRSPRMHNLAFDKLGIDAVYLTFEIDNDKLESAINAMRTLDVIGFNVTMPNKQKVIPYLDELSEEAKLIGAVNTVSNVNGKLKGYNTDAKGFMMNLDNHGVEYIGKKVVMSGAGGAGSAIAIQFALDGVKELVIFDMFEESAKRVAKIINDNTACKAIPYIMDEKHLSQEMHTTGLYVDATPLGMHPYEDQACVSSADMIPQGITVSDITYAPPMTKLLKMAESRGCKVVTGIGMMYGQGAIAFKIWTGQDMPIDYVRAQMEKEDSSN